MAKNLFLSLITFFSRVISGSVIYIVLARIMSIENFGLLSFGTTLAGIVAVMAEFGYSLMSQRDIPQERFNLNKYVFNTIIQKIGFAIFAVLSGVIYLYLFYSGENLKIGLIFIVYAIITSNVLYFYAIFRSKDFFGVETGCSILYAIYLLIVVGIFYFFNLNILFVVYNMLFIRLIQLVVLCVIYFKKFGLKDFTFNIKIQKYLLRNSVSFGLHYVIGFFYFSVDSQFIAYFKGNDSLAIYQAFFKIILIILSMVDLFNNVFLPRLSMLYAKSREDFLHYSHMFNNLVFFTGIFLFLFLNLFASHIINILYGTRYSEAIILTIPFSIVLILKVFSSLYSIILTISDNQRIRLMIVFISLIVNLSLNSYLIPKYGIIGAAYSSSFTHLIIFILYFIYSRKICGGVLLNKKVVYVFAGSFILVILSIYHKFHLNIYLASLILLLFILYSFLILKKDVYSLLKRFVLRFKEF